MSTPTILELILTIPITALGAVLAATGRRLWGLPPRMREGWPLRALGLFYFVVGAWLSVLVWRTGRASWDGVILGYVFVTISLWFMIQRSRKASSPRS